MDFFNSLLALMRIYQSIEAHTLAAEWLHFLNFRSHIDNSFHLPGKRQIVDTMAPDGVAQ